MLTDCHLAVVRSLRYANQAENQIDDANFPISDPYWTTILSYFYTPGLQWISRILIAETI